MRFSTICVFGFAFILHNSLASPLGFANIFNTRIGTVETSKSEEDEIPYVEIEISTVSIPTMMTTNQIETSTSPVTALVSESPTPFKVIEATTSNIIDASTVSVIINETITDISNSTIDNKNDTSLASLGRSKRSCRGFDCEQQMQPQAPPCFGPRCGGYGCACGFQCTIKFRPCCARCQSPPLPPPMPVPPPCNNNGCALPPPACRFPSPQAPPAACPCPQQPEERPAPPACECQPACNNAPIPPPPPPPPRCGCTPRGCGCSRPPFMPSPVSIHINGMGGMNGGDMDFPPPQMPFKNPCASCACPAPVCRCPPACTKQCGPTGCNRPPQPQFPRFPDYDYPSNTARDNDFYDYNNYRHRRSLLYLQNNFARYPFSKQ